MAESLRVWTDDGKFSVIKDADNWALIPITALPLV
jgi:hypothetical protein